MVDEGRQHDGGRLSATTRGMERQDYHVPFQRVLCAFDHQYGYEIWAADVYSHYDDATGKHYLVSGYVGNDNEVIPYEGNEDKLGKSVK